MNLTSVFGRVPAGEYYALKGTWKSLPPGYQFNSTTDRAVGAIWAKAGFWYAQRYTRSAKNTIYKFSNRVSAEKYVRACNEESVNIALSEAIPQDS